MLAILLLAAAQPVAPIELRAHLGHHALAGFVARGRDRGMDAGTAFMWRPAAWRGLVSGHGLGLGASVETSIGLPSVS